MSSLENKGIAIVGAKDSSNRPVVVVGPARGGTSMVAGALAKLGIFMGDLSNHPVYEDVRLSDAMERKDLIAAKLIVDDYCSRYAIWGWKRPSSINYLPLVDELLDQPSYIFVFKDIFSIAMRNSISMLQDLLSGMEDANKRYGLSISFLRQNNPRAMLVSYDKAVLYPDFFVDSVVDFCGIDVTDDQRREAIEFVTPNPSDYLDNSRITKSKGSFDGLVGNLVHGWARYIHSEKPAVVDVYLNDVLIGSATANLPRPDLASIFGVDCAFRFELPADVEVGPDDVLRARVSRDVVDIHNSPLLVANARRTPK